MYNAATAEFFIIPRDRFSPRIKPQAIAELFGPIPFESWFERPDVHRVKWPTEVNDDVVISSYLLVGSVL